jgi:uncharacterized protein (DUF1501 family)
MLGLETAPQLGSCGAGLKTTFAVMPSGVNFSPNEYIALTGFDTHAGQLGMHERLLKIFGEGLAAFQN